MSDRWTERLSDYLDDDMSAAERAELERHLAGCAECAADLEGLRGVTLRARSLDPPALDRDLWPLIHQRIAGPHERRRVLRLPRAFHLTLSLPQALAAGFVLALLSGASVWWVMRHDRAPLAGAGGPVAVTPAPGGVAVTRGVAVTGGAPVAGGSEPSPGRAPAFSGGTASSASAGATGDPAAHYAAYEAHYDQAIADLERTLANNRTDLDTSTVRIVEQNLAIIDRAILQARRALEADPASPYLHQHLALQMKLKLDLLRRAAAYSDGRG
jgi:anti-sigma factor RsiW